MNIKILLFIVLFLGLFLEGLAFSVCPEGWRTILVPAVINENASQVVRINISFFNGSGKIYTKISPLVGLLTQQSTQRAILYAFNSSNFNISECNVIVEFLDVDNSNLLEGPSASLAIALGAYANLKNLSIPSNFAVSGQIFSDGSVGPVGGIIDKANAAKKSNISFLITPTLAFFEKVLLANLTDVKVIEVSSFSQAADALFFNKFPAKKEVEIKNTNLENLQPRTPNKKEFYFSTIAKKINSQLLDTINKNKNSNYYSYFLDKVEQNNILISKGYYYTAANNAFLDLMDASLLSSNLNYKPNISDQLEDIKTCLDEFEKEHQKIILDEQNFELLAGAQARYMWAKTKALEYSNYSFLSSEEKYLVSRELYSAKTWCLAANDLLEVAKSLPSAKAINITTLGYFTNNLFSSLKSSLSTAYIDDPEIKNHFNYAQNLIEQKMYAGALFDIAYTTSFLRFSFEQSSPIDQIQEKSKALLEKRLNSLWGNLYQSQGLYVIKSNLDNESKNKANYYTAYSVLLLAEEQENIFEQLQKNNNIYIAQVLVSPNSLPINFSPKIEDIFVSLFISFYLFYLFSKFLNT
jgi:hypothetical protein